LRDFGVEIAHAKGSEYKLYRPGCKMYTLSGHGPGRDVYRHVVTNTLRRLGIDQEEFWKGL
jgi:hypothetical protein